MPLTRDQKQNIIQDLIEKFKRAKAAVLVDFNKLPVSKTMAFRREMKSNDAEYKVAKKTLISRALKLGEFESADLDNLKTQVGVVFSYNDPAAAANSVWKFSKTSEALKILGGFVGAVWHNDGKIIALAKLPPKEILLGQVVGTIAAPLSGLVNVLQGNIRGLMNVLNQIKK